MIYLEAHPIDPGILHCCYMADNNHWSHRQQPKYKRFMKSSMVVDKKKESTNKGMYMKKKIGSTNVYTF